MKPVYLYSGDEFLVRQAVDAMVEEHVPVGARDFNLTLLDGAAADARTISSHLAIVPMFPGVKLVVVHDTTLLTGKADLAGEVEKAMQLFTDGKKDSATRRMLAVLGRAGWSLAGLTRGTKTRWNKDVGVDKASLDEGVLAEMESIAQEAGWGIPESETETLERLLTGGAPAQNILVLTCEKPDRRLLLTKFIEKHGQHEVLRAQQSGRSVDTLDIEAIKERILEPLGKRLDREAETQLKRAIGNEMRLLASELEKLCAYVGERETITGEDVVTLGVSRVREEAYWELGGAVSGRELRKALWYTHDAFEHRQHPIRIVASITGALRRSLQVRAIAERHGVGARARNLPDEVVHEVGELRGRKPHPFALLKEWERSQAWDSQAELGTALRMCRDADLALKTSGGSPRLVVEHLVFQLCRPGA